ncbi:esterase B1-like isoform X2 [Contarinia nasturtii]|uniref:esterase B1-like isoform X2 n=1 Tax=Contarinia nasturtii TaxID=265458 RepID=UPI0012D42905|nr:esterase B1-like isoform X2 [Contarinia nasturtii]
MFKLILIEIFLALCGALVNGDYLTVNTKSGPIVGVEQETFPNKVPFITFKGIPYAEAPIEDLRFKVPRPVKPWTEPLVTTDKFQPSCLWTGGTVPSSLQSNQSENCLFLNIYTPVLDKIKTNKKLSVLINVHGGGFAVGDGSDANYGPDFIVEENVILVSINYRLGPFGFANFELEGYTGNMGLKDQREALKWVKENIAHFGGDPDSITLFGESAGAAAVHLHVLTDSCEYIKRAIMWSGSAWSHYEKNNHLELLTETFKDELGNRTTKKDLLNFMINASSDVIVQKTPVQAEFKGFFEVFWTPVVEDKTIAVEPFLIHAPHEIYAKNQFSPHCKNVDVSFGITSAEFTTFLTLSNLYGWIEPLKNNSIVGLPYQGLNITQDDEVYQNIQAEIKKFYFGDGKIESTPERLNQYVQMNSDVNFLPAFYDAIRLHSSVSPTFCNFFNISLNANIIKVPGHLEIVEGMGHFEDIQYMFKAKFYTDMYNKIYENRQRNITDQKTVDAWRFVTKLFTDFAKTGSLEHSRPAKTTGDIQCVDITNDGLRSIIQPKKEAMEFWDKIYEIVKPYIVNEY